MPPNKQSSPVTPRLPSSSDKLCSARKIVSRVRVDSEAFSDSLMWHTDYSQMLREFISIQCQTHSCFLQEVRLQHQSAHLLHIALHFFLVGSQSNVFRSRAALQRASAPFHLVEIARINHEVAVVRLGAAQARFQNARRSPMAPLRLVVANQNISSGSSDAIPKN